MYISIQLQQSRGSLVPRQATKAVRRPGNEASLVAQYRRSAASIVLKIESSLSGRLLGLSFARDVGGARICVSGGRCKARRQYPPQVNLATPSPFPPKQTQFQPH